MAASDTQSVRKDGNVAEKVSVEGALTAAPRMVHRGQVCWGGKVRYWRVYSNGLITSATSAESTATRLKLFGPQGGSVAYTEGTSAVAVQQGPSSKPKTLTLDDEKSARVWADVLSTVTRKVGAGDSAKAPDASADGPLYADDCCELYANRLVVKWYFFPAGSKTVPLSSIRSASTIPRSELSIANHKGWGMGPDFTVWWACGMDLAAILSDKLRVVVDQGAWPHVGFSCRDRPSFIKALTPLLE